MLRDMTLQTAFQSHRVLVVGDIMLDHYIYGDVSRISPEAPVPIVHRKSENFVLGGAANVAHAVRALGGSVLVCGVVGDDAGKETVRELFEQIGVPQTGVISSRRRRTSLKQRIVAGSQHMLRIDSEDASPIDDRESAILLEIILALLPGVDIVILSDYAKGVFSEAFTQGLIKAAKHIGKKIIADFKPLNKAYFVGADVIVPNLKEACEIASVQQLDSAGARLVQEYSADVVITLGARGMSLFHTNGDRFDVPGQAVRIFDVTGAGDTVAAALALGLSSGLSLNESADIANCAAALVVQKPGTATVTIDELTSALGHRRHIEQVSPVTKVWGYEKWLENSEKYCAKLLSLNRGYQCSLHYHQNKDETFLIMKGHVKLELRDAVHWLREGNFIRIRPGTPHRFTGIEDSLMIEISSYHDESDSYRIAESRMLDQHEFHKVIESIHETSS